MNSLIFGLESFLFCLGIIQNNAKFIVVSVMLCKHCGASDTRYFYQGQCRRCITFNKTPMLIKEDSKLEVNFDMPFELTSFQEEVVASLGNELKSDVFLEAVCGAGKTEMCLPLLVHSLNNGLSCAWTVPRREIVLELTTRLRGYFPELKIVSVCQGYTDEVVGDLIIATTHQLYRYENFFDVLILDEPDAFPYAGDEMLENFSYRSLKENGHLVYLSATTDHVMKSKIDNELVKHIHLPIRPNLRLLPVPIWRLSIFHWFRFFIDLYRHKEEQSLIFVPSKKMARQLSLILNSPFITSETEEKDKIISGFRNKDFKRLITTTVLERGVTFEEIFGFVVSADHPVFHDASLIQIAGRVQRGITPSKGECYFYSKEKCLDIEKCIENIEEANTIARSVLKT